MRHPYRPSAGTLRTFPIFAELPASNIVRARRWYEETLGFSPAIELGPGLLYGSGGIPFLVYPEGVARPKSAAASWIVDDLRLVMAELRAQGVHFDEYMAEGATDTAPNGLTPVSNGGSAAWFRDSEGNLLSINELPYDLSFGDLLNARRPRSRARRI